MNLLIFTLVGLLLLWTYTLYKSITFKKAMDNYTKTLLNIEKLEGFNGDFIGLLHFVNQQSVKTLFAPKAFIFGLFFKKKGINELKKFSKKELDTYIYFCIEGIKNYLYYAPHWIPILLFIGAIVAPFIALFSSFDKIKHFIIKPIELNLIRH